MKYRVTSNAKDGQRLPTWSDHVRAVRHEFPEWWEAAPIGLAMLWFVADGLAVLVTGFAFGWDHQVWQAAFVLLLAPGIATVWDTGGSNPITIWVIAGTVALLERIVGRSTNRTRSVNIATLMFGVATIVMVVVVAWAITGDQPTR